MGCTGASAPETGRAGRRWEHDTLPWGHTVIACVVTTGEHVDHLVQDTVVCICDPSQAIPQMIDGKIMAIFSTENRLLQGQFHIISAFSNRRFHKNCGSYIAIRRTADVEFVSTCTISSFLNAQFLVFSTQFLVFNTQFLVFNTNFISFYMRPQRSSVCRPARCGTRASTALSRGWTGLPSWLCSLWPQRTDARPASAKFIILNTKFLVFDTKFLVFDT